VSAAPTDPSAEARVDYRVKGMDCAEEVLALRRALEPLPGVDELGFDIVRQRLSIRFTPGRVDEPRLRAAVARTGMRAEPWSELEPRAAGGERWRGVLAGAAALVVGLGWHAASSAGLLDALTGQAPPLATRALYLVAVVSGLAPLLPKAAMALRGLRPDMNLLMTVAIFGALALDDWFEAGTVAVLFALSLQLESWSVGRARQAVTALMDLSPREAELLQPPRPGTALAPTGQDAEVSPVLTGRRVPADEIEPGSLVLVRPGERVPLDGRVVAGHAELDESPITGESRAVPKQPGDEVFAGSINGLGALEIVTLCSARDTTLARIIRLVGEAQGRRSPSERFVERFARVYTPAVMLLALAVGLLQPPLTGLAWQAAFYDALVLLVIACPCALVISTPVSVVCSLASAARQGVLIKGGRLVEEPARMRCLAFDKTGTLTTGRPAVREVVPFADHDEHDLLCIAAAIESRSEHPVAAAIFERARELGCPHRSAEGVRAVPGRGAEASLDGRAFWIGSHRLLEERGQETPEVHETLERLEAEGSTVVILGNDEHVCGFIVLADEPRPEAAQAIGRLHELGIGPTVMLTGDNQGTADAIAARLGIDDVRAELMPEQKLSAVENLVEQHGHVAMVGDGVNDAPAMARSDLGIALGAAGTDAAIETADVVVMGDDLSRLPWLVQHSRRTVATIRQNIVAALGIKAVFIVLAFLGLASLWAAIAADMGVSLLVVANAMRLLRAHAGP
jgi:Cd2+/Zn2+-exporting ATPase